jgi:hypothetical protein
MNDILDMLAKQWPLGVLVGMGVWFFLSLRYGQKLAAKEIAEARIRVEATAVQAKEQLETFSKSAEVHWGQISKSWSTIT